ncbi:ImmA/IrrE family metallo-endopeptidase [Falsiroseomonas sp.]|uniref:ImmA/IrrE family metallo-endopeptidase n=1 Tax=Falsiroseomonas sp. TaxID=2870721 RepID=UPI002724DEA4|nr:hypothetical protein [Falsiroseomonas sp.]MDO9501400.1 hypothetical protein [Falsiroseomonas sp.]
MTGSTRELRKRLREAGLSTEAVEAAWPAWWEDGAEASPSARAELRFALARNLGLSAKALVGERVEFVWRDTARFKHLADVGVEARAALNSFGASVGGALVRSTTPGPGLGGISAAELRGMLLDSSTTVDLLGLLTACWSTGTPVVHLRVSPLAAKSMHAMVVGNGGRHAVLLSRDARYPALTAFTLAHEIGHIALGHVSGSGIIVDAEDPASGADGDNEELAADRYALELLMGSPDPDIRINFDSFNSAELADAVLRAGSEYGVEPGTLALAVAYRRNAYPVAIAAMRLIYGAGSPVWEAVNQVAARELDLTDAGSDSTAFLARILELKDG